MSPLQNKISLKTFGLVYPFEYNFKCHYSTIAPGHLIISGVLNLFALKGSFRKNKKPTGPNYLKCLIF